MTETSNVVALDAYREEGFLLSPTVIVKRTRYGAVGFVTSGKGEEETLLVFRNEEDAKAFQESVGKYPEEEEEEEEEEFVRVNMGRDEIADVFKLCNLSWVAVPHAWTGKGGVDSFTAEGFLGLLDSCPRV
jgi:hypothetical protein